MTQPMHEGANQKCPVNLRSRRMLSYRRAEPWLLGYSDSLWLGSRLRDTEGNALFSSRAFPAMTLGTRQGPTQLPPRAAPKGRWEREGSLD